MYLLGSKFFSIGLELWVTWVRVARWAPLGTCPVAIQTVPGIYNFGCRYSVGWYMQLGESIFFCPVPWKSVAKVSIFPLFYEEYSLTSRHKYCNTLFSFYSVLIYRYCHISRLTTNHITTVNGFVRLLLSTCYGHDHVLQCWQKMDQFACEI